MTQQTYIIKSETFRVDKCVVEKQLKAKDLWLIFFWFEGNSEKF